MQISGKKPQLLLESAVAMSHAETFCSSSFHALAPMIVLSKVPGADRGGIEISCRAEYTERFDSHESAYLQSQQKEASLT